MNFSKFKMENMKIDTRVAIIGPPGSGKTTIIKEILYYFQNVLNTVMIFSGSEELNDVYKKIVPDLFIYKDVDEDTLKRFLFRQQNIKHELGSDSPEMPAAIIIDDCMGNKSWTRFNTTAEIFKNGRHFKTFLLVTLQHCMDLSAELQIVWIMCLF